MRLCTLAFFPWFCVMSPGLYTIRMR
uniref:Uncharacterized protein n=1 Tax=Anguilla anguilla TaxID=7936 RepID=A0A0E9URS2_ANGAN